MDIQIIDDKGRKRKLEEDDILVILEMPSGSEDDFSSDDSVSDPTVNIDTIVDKIEEYCLTDSESDDCNNETLHVSIVPAPESLPHMPNMNGKSGSSRKKLRRDHALTLSSTGTETTADTMGYLMTLLGLHPEWQDKAQRELDDVFGTGGDYLRPVTTADFAQLPVLDAIVKETLRLFPTAPAAPYLVTEDTPLAGGRYAAPRRSTVMVAYYLLHRQPQLFPDPHKFDPSRFLEVGSATNRKPYSYVPFGVGPRKCVGGRYATLQIKTVLSTVLRRCRILPGSSRKDLQESLFSIALFPLTGYRVTFVPRDNIPSSSP
ncbi:cytochrome P450 4g15-like [Schistocerca piceifrons]|uniref:cytochrome P450 4g15-like n=1 Tax=Schistocerca piceifrons TaxID=274613 RepID=UPI001F5EA379|nr:cytochrome P450 4g15-like [Schistocerca piceifrons]